MSWNQEYINFGVLKLDSNRRVRVYKSQTQYDIIAVSEDIDEARWSGNSILIYLSSGHIRKYISSTQYNTI